MISEPIKQLVTALATTPVWSDWSHFEGPRFVTNKITVSIGSFYERLRYAVDYKDEHVLRRATIERIIRRLMIFTVRDDIGRAVLEEMVQASLIQNDTVPEQFATDIQRIIEKYQRLKAQLSGDTDILWAYAAIEIEQHLYPSKVAELNFMAVFQTISQYIKPKETGVVTPERFNLLLYVAARRALMRETHSALSYSLFRIMVPEWCEGISQNEAAIANVAQRFPSLQADIQQLTTHHLQWRIASRLKNETIFFELLHEITRRHGAESLRVLDEGERFAETVRTFLVETNQQHRQKISRSATQAIIYVLITKIIVGLAIELPYEIFVLGEINQLALVINVLFFPFLLMVMTKTVQYPGDRDIDAVVQGFAQFIGAEEKPIQYVKVLPRSGFQSLMHGVFLAVFFAVTFGIVLSILNNLHFNVVSIALFLFFLCIVTYLGLRIRTKAREWALETEDDSFTGLLWFLFILPINRTGRWVSERLSSVNIFVFFMDYVLETPFKLILGSFDTFVSYVKETRRDGI